MTLHVPEIGEDFDTIKAAITYANAGWLVGPIKQGSKHPGSVLDKGKKPNEPGWPTKTSRDAQQISAWFAGSDHGIFLHVGRSGAVVLDVDDYSKLSDTALAAIGEHNPPFQSTRSGAADSRRGHYVFLQPDDRVIGNGQGTLGRAWGEVRGNNGIIVVEPTRHEKSSVGGRYKWINTGPVPYAAAIADALPTATDSAQPATEAAVKAFLDRNSLESDPGMLTPILRKFDAIVAEGGSRHDALRDCSAWACRDTIAGYFSARRAMEALWIKFRDAMKDRPDPERNPRSEFAGVFAWAVAQVSKIDPEKRREEVAARTVDLEFMAGIPMPAPVLPNPTDGVAGMPGRDPSAYFDKSGVMVDLIADDVLAMGPLRVGRDGMFWQYRDGVWREARDEVRGRVVDLLQGKYRGAHASNVEHVVARRVGTIECDPTRDLINFKNVMLRWETGEEVAHDPEALSTVQLPFEWNAKAECPHFDRFLETILEPEFVEFAWEMIGYLLMSGNPLQQAFMLYGTGGNGKGTLMNVIAGMLGHENIATASLDSLNNNRFAAAGLYGRIANIAGDIDSTYQETTASFKSLTGEDEYRAENKHQRAFTFKSWAVPMFSCNEIPGSADTTQGYLRRWSVIYFLKSFTGDDVILNFSDQLLAEAPGIAAKAMDSLRTLMIRKRFDKTKGEVALAHLDYAEKMDQVRQFVARACKVDDETKGLAPGSKPARIRDTEVHRAYKRWAEESGAGKLSAERFYTRLGNIGHRHVKVNGVRWIEGLQLIEGPGMSFPASAQQDPFDDEPSPFPEAERLVST